ncbi:MAG: hypothetical protein H7296_11085 [Bacteroidia bacterium]|nr:hypothetical protein [Bacteroidia bacterium]
METEQELNSKILKVTMTIQENYPELSKYIAEMPVKISAIESPETNINNLRAYYNSLSSLVENYVREQGHVTNT